MTALMEISITNCFSSLKPINSFSLSTPNWEGKRLDFYERGQKKKKVFNQGFGFNGGGNSGRVIGILVLAIGLTYLTLGGQLAWVLDVIVSFWLFAIIAPIVGLGVFLWWAGRDIVQSNCPNCGNEFQVFKSTLNESHLCPYCSAPFSVEDGKFVRDPVKFSKESSPFGQTFNDFPSSFKKGKDSNITVVDVEAEISDADFYCTLVYAKFILVNCHNTYKALSSIKRTHLFFARVTKKLKQ